MLATSQIMSIYGNVTTWIFMLLVVVTFVEKLMDCKALFTHVVGLV